MTKTTQKAINLLFNQTTKKDGEELPLFYNSDMKKDITKNLLKCTDLNTILLVYYLLEK